METGSHKLVPSAKSGTGWRVIFAWVLVAMAMTFAVGSIAYDLGQSDAEKNYTGQIASLQEQAKYSEEVSNTLRENRDAAESRALKCLRALDSTRYEMDRKASVLYDVYAANSEEDKRDAQARVEAWYKEREAVQANLNELTDKCVN